MEKRKRKIIKNILIVVVSLLLACGGLQVYILLNLFGEFDDISDKNGQERTPQEMIDHFNANYEKFHLLNVEILELKRRGLERIDYNWTSPEELGEIGINDSYRDKLMDKMRELSLARGMSCYYEGVEYISYAYGLMISGGSNGYYYSTGEVHNYYEEFPDMQKEPFLNYKDIKRPERGSYNIFLKLRDNWYIKYSVTD